MASAAAQAGSVAAATSNDDGACLRVRALMTGIRHSPSSQSVFDSRSDSPG